jgi:carbon storage regulator CsrA
MIVMIRGERQAVQIGDGIALTIVKIDRDGVRIGIKGSSTTRVVREEAQTVPHEASPTGLVTSRLQDQGRATPRPDKGRRPSDAGNTSEPGPRDRVIELLEQRAEEIEPEIQREILDQLKRSLDENRMSARKLFP